MYFIVLLFAFVSVVYELIRKAGIPESASGDSITVRSERKNRQIDVSHILYLESMSDYVKIFLESGEMVITREKISVLHHRLNDRFIRIHRSYIVNRDRLDAYNREEVKLGEKELPVSRTYKKEFISVMNP